MNKNINEVVREEIEFVDGDVQNSKFVNGLLIHKEYEYEGDYIFEYDYEYDTQNRITKETRIQMSLDFFSDEGTAEFVEEYEYLDDGSYKINSYEDGVLDSTTLVSETISKTLRVETKSIHYEDAKRDDEKYETHKVFSDDGQLLLSEIVFIDGKIHSHTQHVYNGINPTLSVMSKSGTLTMVNYLPSGDISIVNELNTYINELTKKVYIYEDYRLVAVDNFVEDKLIGSDVYTYTEGE